MHSTGKSKARSNIRSGFFKKELQMENTKQNKDTKRDYFLFNSVDEYLNYLYQLHENTGQNKKENYSKKEEKKALK